MDFQTLLAAARFAPDRPPAASAWLGHLHFAAWAIGELKPALVVELGTQFGHSYFALCKAVAQSGLPTRCLAVDNWSGEGADGPYNVAAYAYASAHNAERYAHFSTLLRMSFDEALFRVADASVDLLHIDGLHGYEQVRHDFETWLPKLSPGAVVLFHDTAERREGFGVRRLWRELCAVHPWRLEFEHSHGLGVLWLADGPDVAPPAWLRPGATEQRLVADYFRALGALEQERQSVAIGRAVILERRLAGLEQRFARRMRLVEALCTAQESGHALPALDARLALLRAADAFALAANALSRGLRTLLRS